MRFPCEISGYGPLIMVGFITFYKFVSIDYVIMEGLMTFHKLCDCLYFRRVENRYWVWEFEWHRRIFVKAYYLVSDVAKNQFRQFGNFYSPFLKIILL